MPYASNDDLPDSVKSNIPSEAGKTLFRRVFNSQAERGKTESIAFASAWGALQNAGYNENASGKWVKKRVKIEHDVEKRQINDDVFTLELEAAARSMDLGLGGAIHTHELPDGQAVFMPGATHEEYLQRYGMEEEQKENEEETEQEYNENSGGLLERGISAIMTALLGNTEKERFAFYKAQQELQEYEQKVNATICKVDSGLGLVFGWAVVCKNGGADYFDLQGDHIPEDAMLEAAADFAVSARTAKEMHDGEGVGTVAFMWPMTTDVAKAMGIETDRTGLMIAMKPDSDEVLEKYRNGTYRGFSIGGERLEDEAVE